MTAGAREPEVRSERANGGEYGDATSRWAAPPGCVITADGAYGARLARDGDSWYPERWTLDGPEPYAVPLPGPQPEQPGSEVLPLTDGRVLIHRVHDGRHTFSLLYPTGPGTGELPLGAVECPDAGTVLRLLPPAPDGERAYALAVGRGSTAVWLVAGGTFGPEHLAEVPGHCSGGVWLDRTGRLLALDRFHDGRTKSVVVDLERGGEVSPLLQISEHSNDRLLLADADSGLLLIRSDAPSPGRDRLGWGVLGSTLPVRFPDCLSATGCSISPFAIQPGQVLTPESCAVALRMDGPGGTWVGVWRPTERRIDHRPAPEGWLPGTGLWTAEGVLHLPYVTGGVPCGVARLAATGRAEEPDTGDPALRGLPAPRPVPLQQAPLRTAPAAASPHRAQAPAPTPAPAPGTEQPRALPVHLTLGGGTARAPREEAVHAVDAAARAVHAVHGGEASSAGTDSAPDGTGSVPGGQEPLSTVTSLTPRTSPGEVRRADTHPGLATGAALPPAVRPDDERTEPVPPVARRAPEPARPAAPRQHQPQPRTQPQPSRWTRVPLPLAPDRRPRAEAAGPPAQEQGIWTEHPGTPAQDQGHPAEAVGTSVPERAHPTGGPATPAPEQRRRAEAAASAAAQADLWTKVAETPPPGMSLRTRADGTLPGGMTVTVEPAGPLPPATTVAPAQATAVVPVIPATAATEAAAEAAREAGAAARTKAASEAASEAEARSADTAVAGTGRPTEPAPTTTEADGTRPHRKPTPRTDPGLWTKVAETPPPGMNLGALTGATPAGGTVSGDGNTDAVPATGEFRGQVALRSLAAVAHLPAESGVPSVTAHTDEEKRGSRGEETSPSDSRAMTAR
ncbi:hypothetical protein ACFRIC_08525 [Streptomyces sp. NPDC056738]|uniref:hypothetical protein n=1 Tax=Streptomyces sp. NPDC056738 TaxID=3345933 RepID=UPI0036AFFFFF